jgi:D-alanyl-D-alanine carboxypeptidase/D-alanyl-D-alanine-endopeptidase (penicillin-binding protein 4)
VFQRLAANAGLTLPEPEIVATTPAGYELAHHDSSALDAMLRSMLRYSTNLTAEIVGLRASQARGVAPEGVEDSAAAMTEWARARYGLQSAVFVNHSGLSDRSVWSPLETARVLAAEADTLPALMQPQGLHDAEGRPLALRDVRVFAKTGTLYFSSGLGGYVEGRGRRLAFAIYSTDPVLRADIRPDAPDAPAGSRGWVARARGLQRSLLRRWATLYTPETPAAPLRPLPRRI